MGLCCAGESRTLVPRSAQRTPSGARNFTDVAPSARLLALTRGGLTKQGSPVFLGRAASAHELFGHPSPHVLGFGRRLRTTPHGV